MKYTTTEIDLIKALKESIDIFLYVCSEQEIKESYHDMALVSKKAKEYLDKLDVFNEHNEYGYQKAKWAITK